MPGSVREYNYTIKPEAQDLARVAGQARRVLGWACDGDKRITCYGVKGDALGVLQMSFTVKARDQWYSRELAQDILNMVTWGLANKAEVQLASERLAPHEHRGFLYGRTKRWRDHGQDRSA